MSGSNPTSGDEQEIKGFKGLGQLRAKQDPAPALPASGVSATAGAKALPSPEAPVLNKASKTPAQATQPPIASPIRPADNPRWTGSSLGTIVGWIVAGTATMIGLYDLVNRWQPKSAPATSGNLPYIQQQNASQVPTAPSPQPAYITTALANIRASATARADIVGQLPQWTEIGVVSVEGDWSHINFVSSAGAADGYILSRLIHPGTAQDARVAYCEVATTVRPSSGTVLIQAATGSHSIKVSAGASDALVKLRQYGKTVLAFYVRAHETGKVTTLADGTYQIMFATGVGFSRKCMEFVNSMQVMADPSPTTFQSTQEPTSDGVIVHSSVMEYRLTEQVGGNFKPQTVDARAFQE